MDNIVYISHRARWLCGARRRNCNETYLIVRSNGLCDGKDVRKEKECGGAGDGFTATALLSVHGIDAVG